ncbi:hypothetical protein JCM24511_02330 [Saitozyma sp. JCM 24511]|nr:hypothetical protein JCM24511_02330 [Saitozyma sp. JCM 24511]
MPTELTAAPFKHEQQFPYGLEHPRTWAPPRSRPIVPVTASPHPIPQTSHSPPVMQWASFGGVGIPPTGPARLIDCVPKRVLPNGVRNPWAPYDGSAYRPSSDRVENRAISGSLGTGGMIPAPVAPVAPSSWGGGMAPTVLPSGSVAARGSMMGGTELRVVLIWVIYPTQLPRQDDSVDPLRLEGGSMQITRDLLLRT